MEQQENWRSAERKSTDDDPELNERIHRQGDGNELDRNDPEIGLQRRVRRRVEGMVHLQKNFDHGKNRMDNHVLQSPAFAANQEAAASRVVRPAQQ